MHSANSTTVKMYKPKDSVRWQPKVNLPIRLDDQCLNVIFATFTKAAEKLANGRNIREKKAVREYLRQNVPASLQSRIVQRALDKLVGAQTTLNILGMFEPGQIAKDSVDLLGNFRCALWHYIFLCILNSDRIFIKVIDI